MPKSIITAVKMSLVDELGDIDKTLYCKTIKKIFRNQLMEGRSVLLEWSFACDVDISIEAIGDKYLESGL